MTAARLRDYVPSPWHDKCHKSVTMLDQHPAATAPTPKTGGRIMIVEDDRDIATLVANVLAEEGFATHVVTDSRQALETFQRYHPDLVTLDVMMPSLDGISLCLELRRASDVPILFISAKGEPPDRVVGLRVGADDYMGKPFDNDELVARVEALLRRSHLAHDMSGDRQLRFGRFVIDLGTVQAVAGDRPVQLTTTRQFARSRSRRRAASVIAWWTRRASSARETRPRAEPPGAAGARRPRARAARRPSRPIRCTRQ